jgi:hypothetical protein
MSATALTRYFFRLPESPDSPGRVIGWWESRRLSYNTFVGACGLVTLAAVNTLATLASVPRPGFPVLPVLVYGVVANVCFTGGWIAELALRPIFGEKTPVVGATLFRYGFVFSVGLTLFPISIAGIGILLHLIGAVG